MGKKRLAWFKTSSPHFSHQHRNFGVSCILDSPINGGFLNLGLKQDTEFKQIFKGDKYGEGFWWLSKAEWTSGCGQQNMGIVIPFRFVLEIGGYSKMEHSYEPGDFAIPYLQTTHLLVDTNHPLLVSITLSHPFALDSRDWFNGEMTGNHGNL